MTGTKARKNKDTQGPAAADAGVQNGVEVSVPAPAEQARVVTEVPVLLDLHAPPTDHLETVHPHALRQYVALACVSGVVAMCVVAGLVYAQRYMPDAVAAMQVRFMSTERPVPEVRRGAQVTDGEVQEQRHVAPIYLSQPLVAKAAVVVDTATRETIYDLRADEALPLASLTKLMTAHVVMSVLQDDDAVTITPTAMATEGYDTLRTGEVWTAGTLVDYMLITSSNKAARALRDAGQVALDTRAIHMEFIDYMNATAQRLGMQSTVFTSETGLDIEHDTVATNFGSARDVATLMTYIVTNEQGLLEATEDDRDKLVALSGVEHIAVTTNKALSEIPGLLGGKTGYTDVAGGNLVVAFDVEPGHTIVAVVLGSGKDERFSDMLTLVESVRNQYGVTGERQVRMPL